MTELKPHKVGVSIKGSAILESVQAIKARSGDEGYERIVGMLDDDTRTLFPLAVEMRVTFPEPRASPGTRRGLGRTA